MFLVLPYPPTIIFSARSEDLSFRSKRCFKKEEAVLQVLQIWVSLFFCFSCKFIVHGIVSPVINSARFPTSCLQKNKLENLNFTWSALQEIVMGWPTWIGVLRLASTNEMMIMTYITEDSYKGILVPEPEQWSRGVGWEVKPCSNLFCVQLLYYSKQL